MSQNAIVYAEDESVATVTLNSPESRNAVSSSLAAQLAEICDHIRRSPQVRVVVLAGKGTFCRGTDPAALSGFPEDPQIMNRLAVASLVADIDPPTIAAIHGEAFGQGLELALACDLRICSSSSRLAMDQLSCGLIPWDGGTQRLARLVGKAKAMELILTGQVLSAGESLDLGLVGQVVEPAELEGVAGKMARDLAAKSPLALRYAKEAVHKGMDLSLAQGLRLEADLYFLLHTTGDRAEGIGAFREKRPPRFTGT